MCTIMTSYSESQGFQIWMMWRQAPGGSDVVMAQVLGLGDMIYCAGPGEVSIWLMMEMS